MFQRAHNIVVNTSTVTIKMPPMVGVPFLLKRRAARPPAVFRLVRIILAEFQRLEPLDDFRASHQLNNSAVIAAPAH